VSGHNCCPLGEGKDGLVGIIAICRVDGVNGGDNKGKCEHNVVVLIELITDAREDRDGAGVGHASLNGEGDPNSDNEGVPLCMRGKGDRHFFIDTRLCLHP
jgi:hypothetical protein